jgi:propionyl-CoA synthetase
VVECAVFGTQDEVKGLVPVALLVTTAEADHEAVVPEVVAMVRDRVGAVASLRDVAVVTALPKTRSGKILRNAMRAIADDEEYRLPGTIEDASVIDGVVAAIESLGLGRARR